ncbi:MAG: 50S ribosomal protein L11 methyltransferase [Proteobacteria bacterium]|nr:50S ribosomal protein L11 methyltransferase [Pseudomonadota bacterium]
MWQQLKIQIKTEDCATLEQRLLEHGALSVSYLDAEDDPVFQKEPGSTPLWKNTCMYCLFDDAVDLHDLIQELKQHPNVKDPENLLLETIDDQDWERSWMADFHPMQFGERLWVCPSWRPPPDPDAVNILLDPGLAFGSGTHVTTALCLHWLEQAALKDAELIDYGCGSGILAIAAALLEAASVHAVDNDPQAIAATIDNSYRNNISQGIITAYLPEALPALQADILVANILAEPLLDLSVKFAALLKPGGKIVLSGVLEEQLPSLVSCYKRWFELDEPVIEQEWGLLSGTRKA